MSTNKQLSLLAKRIRTARESTHLSQLELGKSIGVSDKSVSSYEQGRSIPSLVTLTRIAEQTNHPIRYFTEEQVEDIDIASKIDQMEKDLAELKKLLKTQSS